ncbi:MAG: spore coat U domain-containing protein [Gammaproteobacteria bacterium]|nr:spore coat U domain-containing protein [Gammaproteobacteria bacterium]MDH4255354.1 spore coat U domain-containing protein [Gammaproteobacteria bacterium]MDH5310906.1 spore coat U domain-containing protein [Gammaproteobacteria bacterium]
MSKMHLKQKLLGALALAALVSATESGAQQTQQNLNVTVTVPPICTIDQSTDLVLTFDLTGLDDPVAAPATFDNQADIVWRCSTGTAIDISATPGGSGDYAQRLMDDGGTGTLPYNLWTDGSYSVVWGDPLVDVATDYISGVGAGMGTTVNSPVFGRIDLADVENVAPGVYSDDVTVDITF